MRCCRPALQEPDEAMGERQAAAVMLAVVVVVVVLVLVVLVRCKRTKENGRRHGSRE